MSRSFLRWGDRWVVVGWIFILTWLPTMGRAQSVTVEDLLAESLRQLDGSIHVLDRRGNPAAARAAAERAEALARHLGQRDRVVSALVLQARAAASGGDYVRALELREKALAEGPGTVDEQAILALGGKYWWIGQHSSNLESFEFPGQDFLTRYPDWIPYAVKTPKNYSNKLDEQIRVFAAFYTFTQFSTILRGMSLDDVTLATSLESVLQSAIESQYDFCPDDIKSSVLCGLKEMTEVKILAAAGKNQQAIKRIKGVLRNPPAKISGLSESERYYLRGMFYMTLGDIVSAPRSAPVVLNLDIYFKQDLMNQNLFGGRSSSQVGRSSIEAAGLNYRLAQSMFFKTDCARCFVDSELRLAYLHYHNKNFKEANKDFLEVSRKYIFLGDVRYAFHAKLAARAIETFYDFSSVENKLDEIQIDDGYQSRRWGILVGAARLMKSVAAYHKNHLEIPRALLAYDLAMYYARSIKAKFLLGEIAYEKAGLMASIGRRQEALSLYNLRLNSVRSYQEILSVVRLYKHAGKPVDWMFYLIVEFSVLNLQMNICLEEGKIASAYLYSQQFSRLIKRMESKNATMPETKELYLEIPLLGAINLQKQIVYRLGDSDRLFEIALKEGDKVALANAYFISNNISRAKRIAIEVAQARLQNLKGVLKDEDRRMGYLRRSFVQIFLNELEQCIIIIKRCGEYKRALRIWKEAEQTWWDSFPEKRGDPWIFGEESVWMASVNRAEIYAGMGFNAFQEEDKKAASQLFSVAADAFIRTLHAVDDVGSKIGNLADRSGFRNDVALAYGHYTRFLTQLGEVSGDGDFLWQALGVLETSRAKIFHTVLLEVAPASGQSPLRSWWRVRSEAEALRISLVELSAEGKSQRNEARKKQAQLERLKRDEEAAQRRLGNFSVAKKSFQDQLSKNLSEIQKVPETLTTVNRPTALIAYFVHPDSAGAWVLNDSGITFRQLSKGPRRIGENLAILATKLNGREKGWEESARALYQILVEPIEDLLPRSSEPGIRPRLGIVPHGGLSRIPFTVLLKSGSREDRPLIDDYDIFLLPSVRYFAATQERDRDSTLELSQAVSFGYNGDRLDAAEQEARTVANLLDAKALTASQATARRLEEEGSRASILHLAAHTRIEERNPFLVAIELNDPLHVYELAGQNWSQMDLVTLSGCETGLGEWSQSDEVIGLARMFLTAGVRTVVASQWLVDDEITLTLMRLFYGNIKNGQDPLSALMNAQRHLRRDGYPPALWASFSLYGQV